MNIFSSKKEPVVDKEVHEQEVKRNPFTEIAQFAIVAILIVIPVRMFIAQPFIVSGASMEDTFHSGEYLIVDQLSYHMRQPERGEVIIFRYPRDPSKFFIKRIIGLPGDTVHIENSIVTITNETNPKGLVLEESYIDVMTPQEPMTEILGDREYFVMGDNRDESSDSRSWGVLQEERIVGRALFRLFPPNEINFLPGSIADEDITSS
jgi:signal peptidase I